MCGEQCWRGHGSGISRGSPPRVRGTVFETGAPPLHRRITPACAGNRMLWRTERPRKWDHPRVCGEQDPYGILEPESPGSPPRVRGTAASSPPAWLIWRITPACAGNSPAAFPPDFPAWDHPRVCGEQQIMCRQKAAVAGSPPRVRGTATERKREFCICRITPACAGNSDPGRSQIPGLGITPACAGNRLSEEKGRCTGKDHPRVCGEQLLIFG